MIHEDVIVYGLPGGRDYIARFEAALVLRAGSDHQHETCTHADCAVHTSRCPLREALEASSDRINREGQALLAEYHQRREGESG
jgi:hypothetical protein